MSEQTTTKPGFHVRSVNIDPTGQWPDRELERAISSEGDDLHDTYGHFGEPKLISAQMVDTGYKRHTYMLIFQYCRYE